MAEIIEDLGNDVFHVDTRMGGYEGITSGYLIRSSRPCLIETGTARSADTVIAAPDGRFLGGCGLNQINRVHRIANAAIHLQVNGQDRQRSTIAKLIWNIAETIEQLSAAWTLQPGDLIFTGTPSGVGPVVRGDRLHAQIAGVGGLDVDVIS